MPEDLGDLHVLDNIPEFTMRVLKNSETVHQEVGRRQAGDETPIFSADMKEVIFHPDWGVPDSIKVNELAPYLRRGSATSSASAAATRVLERHNLRVSYNGRPVDASMVDWNSVDIRRFTFIQPAGCRQRSACSSSVPEPARRLHARHAATRALQPVAAHVQPRLHAVQNPRWLAEVLLGEDQGMSAAHVGNLLARGQQTDVQLRRKIPVHVAYFTAVVDERGSSKPSPTSTATTGAWPPRSRAGRLPLIEPREEVSDVIAPPREARRSGRT